jgi:DNA repair protein RadA/Sms
MAKIKTKWICQNCGYESSGHLGKCPDCYEWNSMVEEVFNKPVGNASVVSNRLSVSSVCLLKDIEVESSIRFSTDMGELDRVLGGGLVRGSVVLLGGDPGIGKSTIVLQACGKFSNKRLKVLYVSAEESAGQLRLRSERLNINSENLYVYPETCLDLIKDKIVELSPDIVVIDSIQAVYCSSVSSSPGSVSQVRESCSHLTNLAKSLGITFIIIGHVTKEGFIAGPKVLEHMVDVVLQFEGEKYRFHRILRTIKNRFGGTDEVGLFKMEEEGLVEVQNPSELFLSNKNNSAVPGNVTTATCEGTRPLFVEVQSLVGYSSSSFPRRVATGIEYNRLLQIIAVLEKRIGFNLGKQDVYASVLGGLTIQEPAADLGVALSIVTCIRNVIVDPSTVVLGEIGLSGEIRGVSRVDVRVKEAVNLGFKKIIIPKANLPIKNPPKGIEILGVARLSDAITGSVVSADS